LEVWLDAVPGGWDSFEKRKIWGLIERTCRRRGGGGGKRKVLGGLKKDDTLVCHEACQVYQG